ncbi:hypothetical protein PSAC2689_70218 [Paraburkholderia sacchari]
MRITDSGRVAGTVVSIDVPSASAFVVGRASIDSPEVRRVALRFDERVPEYLKQSLKSSREIAS